MHYLLPLLLILLHCTCGRAQTTVPLTPENWDAAGYDLTFVTHRGRPAMRLDDGGTGATGKNLVTARGVDFRNGTLEYDVALDEGARFASGYFRVRDKDNLEHVYLRAAFTDDPMNSAGFQYAAVVDGVNYWDLSFEYQTGVAMKPRGEWNHVKLVIRDRQLLAYVNDMDRPALYIPILDGETESGAIGFDGKAWIANVTYAPNVTPGLAPGTGYDPTHNDVRYLRNWQVTQPTILESGREVTAADLPGADAEWSPITAERFGLVNLSRRFGPSNNGRRLAFLKTTITAGEKTVRQLHLGISDEVTIFINGKYLYAGKNPYGQPGMLFPRGRATPENVTIDLPLEAGENEIVIGVANYFFGWGIVGRLSDGGGLRY